MTPAQCATLRQAVGDTCQYEQMSIDTCTADCEQAIKAPDTETNWRTCGECFAGQSSCDNFNANCLIDTASGPMSCGAIFTG